MACVSTSFPLFGARDRNEYACVGVPPEKEVSPEVREDGATLAALARILRGASARPADRPTGGSNPNEAGGDAAFHALVFHVLLVHVMAVAAFALIRVFAWARFI